MPRQDTFLTGLVEKDDPLPDFTDHSLEKYFGGMLLLYLAVAALCFLCCRSRRTGPKAL